MVIVIYSTLHVLACVIVLEQQSFLALLIHQELGLRGSSLDQESTLTLIQQVILSGYRGIFGLLSFGEQLL